MRGVLFVWSRSRAQRRLFSATCAQRLQGAVGAAKGKAKSTAPVASDEPKVESNATATRVLKKPRKVQPDTAKAAEPDDKKFSAVAAALKVLGESKEPMNAKEMIAEMDAKGYWTSPGGKTPHATLYSAILRDLSTGDAARFVKTERGRFAART